MSEHRRLTMRSSEQPVSALVSGRGFIWLAVAELGSLGLSPLGIAAKDIAVNPQFANIRRSRDSASAAVRALK